jgi:hypothetical protein
VNPPARYRHTPHPAHPDGCWCQDCWQPATGIQAALDTTTPTPWPEPLAPTGT